MSIILGGSAATLFFLNSLNKIKLISITFPELIGMTIFLWAILAFIIYRILLIRSQIIKFFRQKSLWQFIGSLPDGVSLTLFSGLPFWYLAIRLFLSCCQPYLYPDQNPFAGTGLSFHTVASCTLRHRFCISSACSSSLLWVHPTPLNALVWLSHTGYTSPTFAPSVEFIGPETSRV